MEKCFTNCDPLFKNSETTVDNRTNERKRKLEDKSYPDYSSTNVPLTPRESPFPIQEWKSSPPPQTDTKPNYATNVDSSLSTPGIEYLSRPITYPSSESKSFANVSPTSQYDSVINHFSGFQNTSYFPPVVKICKCLMCEKIFMATNDLKNHVCYYPRKKLFKCPDSDSALQEKFSQPRSTKKPYKCMLCPSKFSQPSDLQEHLIIHSSQTSYTCSQCNSSFSHLLGLQNHLCFHTEEKSYMCELCHLKFNDLNLLQNHLHLHRGEKLFECSDCDAKFTQLSGLQTHKQFHSGEKLFKCTYCELTFVDPTALKNHWRIHNAEKPFNCLNCDSSFQQLSLLKNHSRLHSNEKTFTCEHCKGNFSKSSELKNHIRIIHGIDRS